MLKKCLSVMLAVSLVLGVSAFSLPAEAEDRTLRFNSDGKFKIVVFADCQDDESPYQEMLDFMDFALTTEQPDLVVFTGDNVHVKTNSDFATGCRKLLEPINAHQVPFAYTYGNHDAEYITKEYMYSIYAESPYCLTYDQSPDITGFGNCNLPIYSSAGEDIAFNLWIIDSNMYASSGSGYDNVHQDQQDWIVATDNELTASVGHKVNSLVFQHIVVPEVYNCLVRGNSGTTKTYNGVTYTLKLNENASGYLGEFPCPPNTNSGEFTTLKNMGSVLGIVTGHDHSNSFVGHWQGVDFIQMPGMTFESYGDSNCRGYGVIELDENDTTTYNTYTVRYVDRFLHQIEAYRGVNDHYYSIADTGTYISDLAVGSDSKSSNALSALTDEGYTPIEYDLNKGAGGNYIYLGYKTTNNYADAIKDIRIYSEADYPSDYYYELNINGVDCGYYMYGTDLNKESGGDYVFFYATKNSSAGAPISQISFDTDSSGTGVCGSLIAPDTPADLNKNTTKHQNDIYCFTSTSATDVTAAAKDMMAAYAEVSPTAAVYLSRYTVQSRTAFLDAYNTASSLVSSLDETRYTQSYTAQSLTQLASDLRSTCAGLTTLSMYRGCIPGAAFTFDAAQAANFFNSDYVTVEVKHNTSFPKAVRVGTGCTVNVTYPGGTKEYETVVFGDIDGDGWYNGSDAFLVNLVVKGRITPDNLTDAQLMAADCNHDGLIDDADVSLLEQAGILLSQVDQTMPQEELVTNEAYLQYLSIIDQSPNAEIQEEPVIVSSVIPESETKASVFNKIIEFFRRIIAWVFKVLKIDFITVI